MDEQRWQFYRVDPLLRREDSWLVGIAFTKADGRWDTVHRLRFGLGRFVWELAWWYGPAWSDMQRRAAERETMYRNVME